MPLVVLPDPAELEAEAAEGQEGFVPRAPAAQWVAVASGHYHNVLLTDRGEVYTYGKNESRQLGWPAPLQGAPGSNDSRVSMCGKPTMVLGREAAHTDPAPSKAPRYFSIDLQ